MPEAGRRVKCSETHQPFLRTSYPHMQTLSKRTSYPTQIYLSFIFFSIFRLAVTQLQRLSSERSPPCSTLCPTYQATKPVSKHFNHDILCYSENRVLLTYTQASFACHDWMVSTSSHSITITTSTKSQ